MNFKTLIKPLILATLSAIIVLVFFSGMKNLPSPIYGGDVYYHYGVIKHIYDGNSPLENSQFEGEWAHYPWLMHVGVAYLAKITGNPFKTALFFPAIMIFVSVIISWLLARKLFENEPLAIIFSILFTSGIMVPMLTATAFTIFITFPLFVLLAYFYSDTPKKCIFVGIALGLVGLSQVAGLAAAILFCIVLSLIKLISKQSTLKREVINLSIIFAVGGTISLLFWYGPLFDYHLQTPNRWSSYVASGEGIGVSEIITKLKVLFFNFENTASSLLSTLALVGLVLSVLLYKKNKSAVMLPLALFLTAFLGFIHPMIALPLLGISIGSYGFDIVFLLAIPLLVATLFYIVMPKVTETDQKSKLKNLGVLFLATLLVLFLAISSYSRFDKDIWTQAGRSDSSLAKDLKSATDILDKVKQGVILPLSDEGGFAINAISGKKVVYARRTHTSPFVDSNKRSAEAAVMMFGNDTEVKKRLFEKYGVKYFYADQYGVASVSGCYGSWENITGDLSFNCLRTSEEYVQYLTNNGIETKVVNARLDPASAVAPTFDIVIIRPNPIDLNITPIYTTDNLQLSEVTP